MIEEARKKILEEMEKSKDPYVKAIGDYLLKQVEINRDAAIKINTDKKSIKKSLEEVKSVARKRTVGGCAVMEDREVFKLVRKYYEFEAVQDKFLEVEVEEIKEKHEIEESTSNVIYPEFNVKFEDFI